MIRITYGNATVTLEAAAESRDMNGDLNLHYLVGDLLAATRTALTAAGRPDLAAELLASVQARR